jgi:hypothetical protein
MLALGYGREAKIKKEKVKCELRGRHSNCYWGEVSRRAENMERSTEKQVIGRKEIGDDR